MQDIKDQVVDKVLQTVADVQALKPSSDNEASFIDVTLVQGTDIKTPSVQTKKTVDSSSIDTVCKIRYNFLSAFVYFNRNVKTARKINIQLTEEQSR